jgi:hypothetical protein
VKLVGGVVYMLNTELKIRSKKYQPDKQGKARQSVLQQAKLLCGD